MKKFKNTSEGAKELAKFLISKIEKLGTEKFKLEKDVLSTIFVAGAPGAGKTEFVETVLDNKSFIVIDIDKYRNYFEGYNGENSPEFQDSCSRVATRIFDFCIKKKLKIIFDGTLTSEMGLKNVEKALHKQRKIGVILVYQNPTVSYSYTIARQLKNERKVSIEAFLRIYFKSIENSFKIKEKYGDEILFIVGARNKNKKKLYVFDYDKKKFDEMFNVGYNEEELEQKLKNIQKTLLD